MRKAEIKICIISIIIIAMLIFCFLKEHEIQNLREEKTELMQKKKEIQELSEKISNMHFVFTKTQDKFIEPHDDIKKILMRIAKKSHVKQVKLKRKKEAQKYFDILEFEVQFSAESEKYVYSFIENIRNEFNCIFDSIKIIKKEKKNFIAKIKCRHFQYKFFNKYIEISPIKKKRIMINRLQLFQKDGDDKKYFLHGIIDQSKAYINNEWKRVGDMIGDYTIETISGDSITLKGEDEQLAINLGDSW